MADRMLELSRVKRVVIKLSGELLSGEKPFGLDTDVVQRIAAELAEITREGIQLTIIVGGGNIFRGLEASRQGIDRITGDQIGMLATVLNGLALKNALEKQECQVKLFSAVKIETIADSFVAEKARHNLQTGGLNIAVAGTGHPYFTTDTSAVLRALQLDADLLLKATRVDGVYDSDPEKDPEARRFETISFQETLSRNLQFMDLTATSLCQENNLPVIVFNMDQAGNLLKLLAGEQVGTFIHGDDQ